MVKNETVGNAIRLAAVAALVMGISTGCKGKGGTLTLTATNNANSANKPLFSEWVEVGNSYKIDLRQANYGVISNATVTAVTGQACACQVMIQGTEQSGNITVSNCNGVAQCSLFNSAGTYTRANGSLNICAAANSCNSFK